MGKGSFVAKKEFGVNKRRTIQTNRTTYQMCSRTSTNEWDITKGIDRDSKNTVWRG